MAANRNQAGDTSANKVARSRVVASIAVFAALTVALNLSPIRIPAPYAPFLIYQIWEIPIVAALFLYGLKAGVAISVMNTIVLLGVFPGALPIGPLYNLIAALSTILGVYVVCWLAARNPRAQRNAIFIPGSTAVGAVARVLVMTVVNWVFLRYPPPVGFSMPNEAIIVAIPIIGVFNATLALYTIPAGYLIAKAVASSMRMNEAYLPRKPAQLAPEVQHSG